MKINIKNRKTLKIVLNFMAFVVAYGLYTGYSWITQQLTAAPKAEQKMQATVPSTFGKTHFIVGMPQAQAQDLCNKSTKPIPSDSAFAFCGTDHICQALFSPDDGIEKKLIDLIDHEQSSMRIAIFQLTDIEVARALKRAKDRGVVIEIVADPSCLQDKFNKISLLKALDFTIFVYNAQTDKATLSNRMHHKFVVFEKTIGNRRLVWVGSYNFTKSADTCNQESVMVIEDDAIYQKFSTQFARLKERSFTYTEYVKHYSIVPVPNKDLLAEKKPRKSVQNSKINSKNESRTIA